ncbi:uncharacterized protein KGF55_003912 [Candida pseudojiufengensis]|uniref:uncharacterized protein n=1 Tax=Candida pseudojiufengensis TaxID=497109 RepID=UPI0022246151|nr:uncharacterized protein KGF55_003912 [Candida pseudojiufengensis]KAI5961595.1 hypothetical protein KGF55_003912 [Candida pseudojiufengensis]
MATASVHQQILDGNIHKKIPLSTYESNLEPTLQNLESLLPKTSSEKLPKFDPMIHLQYYSNELASHKYNNTRRITMKELGLENPNLQISPIGVSDPFPLFTEEAVTIMKKELLTKDIFMENARYCFNSTSGLDCCLRGYVKTIDGKVNCPFIYEAWTNPKTMELISKMAGVDLEIIMNYEIGHVNISIKSNDQANEEIIKYERLMIDDKKRKNSGDDIPAVVGWHYDSYPFVCVLMLSDTTKMIGGETSLRMGTTKGENQVAIIPSPQLGSASVLQGRLIEHIAPTPLGLSERMTMVTSFRAKNPSLKDSSILNTVKPEINFGSRYNEFYSQWINYRCELIKQKMDLINNKVKTGDSFNKDDITNDLKDVEDYVKKTYEEMMISKEEMAKMFQKK